jgi:hypothetical protein
LLNVEYLEKTTEWPSSAALPVPPVPGIVPGSLPNGSKG